MGIMTAVATPPDNAGDDLATVTRAGTPVSPGAGVGARLRAVHPRDVQWDLELGSDRRVIGRVAHDSVPPLAHETVSRRHVEIGWSRRAQGHVIGDLGSHNGSRVGGHDIGQGGGGRAR